MDPTSIGVACSITGPGEGQVGGHLQFLYRSALLRHGRPCREASLTPRDADLRSDWSMTRGEKTKEEIMAMLSRWDPWRDVARFQEEVSRMFEDRLTLRGGES